MSATRMPKFLLGGINFRMNFLGSKTIQTSAYGAFECFVKVAPVFVLLGFSGKLFCFNFNRSTQTS